MEGEQQLEPPSFLSKYGTRGALIYYALILPALVGVGIFSTAAASTSGALVASSMGDIVAAAVTVLPFALLIVSIYAVITFRPSLLVTFLVISFFIAASVTNGISLLGAQLDLGAMVVLVVVATFLALAGFNYSRGLKLLDGRRANVASSGPLGFNALGVAVDSFVPPAMALILVIVVEAVVGNLGTQATQLPAPLSTLASLYLQTRIGLVFTTLLVAGAVIWILRQFVEPVILHFTLTAADAKKELLSEIEPTTKSVRKIIRYRPSKGLSWGVLMTAYSLAIIAALAYYLPSSQFSRDLLTALNLESPSPSPVELLVQNGMQNALVRINISFAQLQDYIREGITLLWG